MVTLNINIEGDGKSTSSPVSTTSLTQQDMPSPTSLGSSEGVTSVVPSPDSFDQSSDSGLTSESVPHPEESGIAISTISDQTPSPIKDSGELAQVDTGIPEPSDTDISGTPTPATKRKPIATKSRTSKK